jgi:leucyl aminopeptidase
MKIQLEIAPLEQVEADALVVPVFDKESPGGGLPFEIAQTANDLAGGWIEELYRSGEFNGKALEMAMLHRPPGMKARRLLVVGVGKSDKFSPDELRKAAGAALRHLKPKSSPVIALALNAGAEAAEQAAAGVEGAILGDYEPDQLKTDKKDVKSVDTFVVAVPGGDESLGQVLEGAQILAESQNFARALANEPANRMTPAKLAERAHEMAGEAGLECYVLDREQMRQLGMGALLGVAQGSAEPPVMIVLRYQPLEPAGEAHLGLVGKGVTFDSGGISIKPSADMDKMKYDMAGGASVIGAMRAIARLRPPVPVTALIPAVENMPGSRAQRPGDIVTTLSGKTVEVLNTDAEGRLILADALTYARTTLGCTHLVDAATLTGAIVVALGHVNVGVFASDDGLRERVLDAAKAEGEKMWPMPLDDEYKEALKSAFADLPNVGNRWGGAITAAIFLKEFADTTPWVHLDIAGTAWLDDAKPFQAKGPTGVAVRTLARLAANWVA